MDPRQHPEKLIPKVIYNIINNKKIPYIWRWFKNSREWIYVRGPLRSIDKSF